MLLIFFNSQIVATEPIAPQANTSSNNTRPNIHVRFINNNRHTLVQSFSGPGHRIEIATRKNREEKNRENSPSDIVIEHESSDAATPLPHNPNTPTTDIINHNDMIVVQAHAQDAPQDSSHGNTAAPQHTHPRETAAKMGAVAAFSLFSWVPSSFSSWAKLLVGCSALCYGALLIKILTDQHAIESSKTWSCWKEDLSIAILRNDEQLTAKQLFADMQTKYGKPIEKNNFFGPIVSFMQSTEQELTLLQQYEKIYAWITTYKLCHLLPDQKGTHLKAKAKIERLEYIRQLIVTFASEYKVE